MIKNTKIITGIKIDRILVILLFFIIYIFLNIIYCKSNKYPVGVFFKFLNEYYYNYFIIFFISAIARSLEK